jgi:hypothetical protein
LHWTVVLHSPPAEIGAKVVDVVEDVVVVEVVGEVVVVVATPRVHRAFTQFLETLTAVAPVLV